MAAKDSTKKKKIKPPKGFAQLPEWWMEMTPHNTLYPEGDAAKRHQEMLSKAGVSVGGESSKYSLGENGELLDKKTGEPIETGGDSGFTRDEKSGEWLKDGKPIFGRQFSTTASSPEYGHHNTNWEKPDWMKHKLKASDKGAAMKKGEYLEKKL